MEQSRSLLEAAVRFSVIIPLYNKAAYVRKAVESVLGQSFRDFELIVVDDGSTDESAGIVEGIQDSRIRLIRQENAGVSVARNNGVAASSAPYLCFLDADDWWEPSFLEEMDKLIDEFPDAGIYGTNYTIVNETKRKTRIAPIGLVDGFERGYINYCQAYSKHLGMPLTSSSVCIPKDVFIKMGGFPKGLTLGEDFILWIHIALQLPVAFLNRPLSNYNQDVDENNRAAGRLHPPQHHMLWNLQDLEMQEATNPDYKYLIDCLRANNLMPYYLSSDYHDSAVQELAKIDWSGLSSSLKHNYDIPLPILRAKYRLLKWGVRITRILR